MNEHWLDPESWIIWIEQVLSRLQTLFANFELPPALLSLLSEFLEVMDGGGILMWVLFCIGLLLWYSLFARLAVLGLSFSKPSRRLVARTIKYPNALKLGLITRAAGAAVEARTHAMKINASREHFVEESITTYRQALSRHATMIKTIVIIAPLVGLLGTVLGMIETFDALQTMEVFSQSSSIAGGISKALFTTQMGLVVAVPGLLLGRLLDRRQAVLESTLDEIQILASIRSR